jgi:hypothetical protein
MPTKDADPRQVLLDDVRRFMLQQQEKGDIIIVGIHANEDVRGRTIKQLFAALQMHDAILTICTAQIVHLPTCTTRRLNPSMPASAAVLSALSEPAFSGRTRAALQITFNCGPTLKSLT